VLDDRDGRGRDTACEGGGDGLLNAADAIGLDSGHNLIHEPFDQ
jgi:hypothetical protein